jgi:high-affinity iron transporter
MSRYLSRSRIVNGAVVTAAAILGLVLLLQAITTGGHPDPLAASAGATARVIDISVLVFREGLECILVLAAVTANMTGERRQYQRPVAAGAALAFVASLITWQVAVTILDSLTESVPALDIQAATGLLAIVVLLVVMNWFFHKVYWTGWISMHSRKRQTLLGEADGGGVSQARLLWGFALLGFSSLYREGFEIVLFLQSYRLKLGGASVLYGVAIGLLLTLVVAVLTFVARRHLVLTGVLLGVVLLVMVGEQAQEMQLANWLPTTPVLSLERIIPDWMGLWFAVFPTVETIAAQLIAAAFVLGSYRMARATVVSTNARQPAAPQAHHAGVAHSGAGTGINAE